jgi:hypothetical protein
MYLRWQSVAPPLNNASSWIFRYRVWRPASASIAAICLRWCIWCRDWPTRRSSTCSLAAYEARFRETLAERLPAATQASYFRLVRRLLDRMPAGESAELERGKHESAGCLLEMSLQRPI